MVEIKHPTASKIKQLGIPIKLSETPGEIRAPAPSLGQHTNELLLWLGYKEKEIDEIRDRELFSCGVNSYPLIKNFLKLKSPI